MAARTAGGKKKAQKTSGVRKRFIAVVAVIVLLAAAYCALCGVVSTGSTLRSGTSVNGIDIGGMTRDEAAEALQMALSGVTAVEGVDYSTLELDPNMEGVGTYTIDLSASLGYDTDAVVEEAYAYDRGGFFLTRGLRWLSTVGGGRTYTILPGAVDADQVSDALEACGILELNTTVQTTYTLNEETLDFTMGVSGVAVDEEALVQQILERTAQGDYSAITCPLVSTAPEAVDVQAIYDEIYTESADATLDVAEDNSYTVVASVRGVSFDVDEAEAALAAAREGEVVSIALDLAEPTIDTETLESVLFRDVLVEYSTSVSGSAARRSNVRLASEKCNGTILLPGEIFSYNDVVGERTVEAGFQEAPAYLNGETVQALGGGICQGSSTLYCACLYANLEIVARTNHSFVSSYVPLGMDATVSWGGPEFQFKNNTDYPIMIVATYSDSNKLTFQILGTDVNNYTVKITSTTLEVISPTVTEVEDSSMEAGTTKVTSSGHTGYKVQTYRYVYDADGNLVSQSEEAYSSYRMTPKVVRVGTKVVETTDDSTTDDGSTDDGDTGDTGGEDTDTVG